MRTVSLPAVRIAGVNDNATGAPGIPAITRSDVERALWSLTGWGGDQSVIDGLMIIIDSYAVLMGGEFRAADPVVRENWAHLLVTLAAQITDSGARMHLAVPSPAADLGVAPEPASPVAVPPLPEPEPFGPDLPCRVCGLAKPADAFSVDRARPTGRKSICKDCQKSARAKASGRSVRGAA